VEDYVVNINKNTFLETASKDIVEMFMIGRVTNQG
jgi:hypothetical protein